MKNLFCTLVVSMFYLSATIGQPPPPPPPTTPSTPYNVTSKKIKVPKVPAAPNSATGPASPATPSSPAVPNNPTINPGTAPSSPAAPSSPSATSHTTSSSKTKIDINMDGDKKLKLRSDESDFTMDLDFEKVDTKEIRQLLVKHLGGASLDAGKTEVWSNKGGTYKIKLKKGSLDVSIDKDITNRADKDKLTALTKDVFDALDMEVDVDGF